MSDESEYCLVIMIISLQRMVAMHERMMKQANHAASAYDADTIREMNEAPIEAEVALQQCRRLGYLS